MGKTVVVAMKCYCVHACLLTATAWILACTEPTQPRIKPKAGAFDPVAHADKRLKEAREKFRMTTTPDDTAWQLGAACFKRAEFAKDNPERAALAQEGIDACRKLVAEQPKNPGGHYYLSMNIGQMARVRQLKALGMVKEMEHHFNLARELDETFSHAGSDRNLGLLYFRAPRFISVGNKERALKHLRRAAKLAPEYPSNLLNLLEAHIDAEDENGVAAECATLEILMPVARKKFLGDNWSADWIVWNKRWHELRGKVYARCRALKFKQFRR